MPQAGTDADHTISQTSTRPGSPGLRRHVWRAPVRVSIVVTFLRKINEATGVQQPQEPGAVDARKMVCRGRSRTGLTAPRLVRSG
jgi:hypothetical protein